MFFITGLHGEEAREFAALAAGIAISSANTAFVNLQAREGMTCKCN